MEQEIVLLGPVEKAGLAVMVLLLMLGMGATLTWPDFKRVLQHPRAVLIGFVSQFGLMRRLHSPGGHFTRRDRFSFWLTGIQNTPLTMAIIALIPQGHWKKTFRV